MWRIINRPKFRRRKNGKRNLQGRESYLLWDFREKFLFRNFKLECLNILPRAQIYFIFRPPLPPLANQGQPSVTNSEAQPTIQNHQGNDTNSVTADLLRAIESTDERVPVKDEQPSYLEKLQQIAFQWFFYFFTSKYFHNSYLFYPCYYFSLNKNECSSKKGKVRTG